MRIKQPACQSIFTRIKPDKDENTHCDSICLTARTIKLNTDSGTFTHTIKDDKTEENTFEILQHSDRNINNS